MLIARRLVFVALLALSTLPLSAHTVAPLPGSWADATAVQPLPDGSLLVVQATGAVDRLVPEGRGYRPPVPWADLSDGGRLRVLALAVDPDFLSNGYLYVLGATDATVSVTRWRDAAGLVVLNTVLVSDLPGGTTRTGSVLEVGPDRRLWVGLGDGGQAAAEVTGLRSTLLRYELDGRPAADNPDPASPIWARGFRDPAALAWQPDSGRVYSLDRGPEIPRGTNDRLDLVTAGNHLGWPQASARQKARGFTQALIYCASGHTWVPTAATFATVGEWKGSLLFTGSGEGVLYRVVIDPKTPTKITFYEELFTGELGPLMDIALLADGTLVMLSAQKLYRVQVES